MSDKKFKIFIMVSTLCLAVTMLVFGVMSLFAVQLNISGNVNFTADGVKATISQGTILGGTNTGTATMNAITIDGGNNSQTVETNLATWYGLNLSFNNESNDIIISFTITNMNTTDYLEIVTSVDSGDCSNAVINTSSVNTVLYPSNSDTSNVQTFFIYISAIDDNYDVNVTGFTINLYLRTYEIPDESNYSGILTFGSKVAGTSGGIGTASVKGATNTITQAKIPFLFKNGSSIYKVTSIEMRGFRYFESLSSITIPNSVTSIGNYAFEGCIALTNVLIPNSVTSTGSSVFASCSSLQSVTLSNSITQISSSMFEECESLNNVVLPQSIININDYAFAYCNALISIRIGDNVQSIGDCAFNSCDNLSYIKIGNAVDYIGMDSFQNTNVSSIIIPYSVTEINENAFRGCSNLKIAVFERIDDWFKEEYGYISSDEMANYIKAGTLLRTSSYPLYVRP